MGEGQGYPLAARPIILCFPSTLDSPGIQSLGPAPGQGSRSILWTFGEQAHFPCLGGGRAPVLGKENEAGRVAGFTVLLKGKATLSPQTASPLSGEEEATPREGYSSTGMSVLGRSSWSRKLGSQGVRW